MTSAFPLLALLACLTAVTSCTGETPPLPGSHLLLVTIDTTRADALGCYGGPGWATPVMDELAGDGVRFDQARATAPVTLPSHATILTGLFPFEHGVRDNATFRLPADVRTLAERLRDEGYASAAVTGAFVLHSDFGLDQGFEIYSDVPLRDLTLGIAEDQRTAAEVVDEALAIVKEKEAGRPLFLWVHFFDPHYPYDPGDEFMQLSIANAPPGGLTEKEMPRRRYLGEVAYMDREIGRLLRGLRDRLGGDRILTAIVSDHGEGLGDHGEKTHGFGLFDTTMRVPMILHHEGLPGGRIVDEPVSINDLAPTLMSLLGLSRNDMSGADLSPFFGMGEGPVESVAYYEAAHPYYNYNWAPLFAVNDERFKLIEGPNPELYDLTADPEEMHNVIARHADQADRLRAMFDGLRGRARKAERIALSREDHGRIEALGYAGSGLSSEDDGAMLPGRVDPHLRDPAEGLELKDLSNKARSLALTGSEEHMRQAVSIMQSILGQDPDNPTFLAYAGSIFFRAKMYREAANALRRSLEDLESATSRETLASCLMNLDRDREAVEVLEIGVELHPYDLVSRFKLGEALLNQGRAREALEHLDFFVANHMGDDKLNGIARKLQRRAAALAARQN